MSRRIGFAAAVVAALSISTAAVAGDFDGAYGGVSIGWGDDPLPNSMDHSLDLFVGYNFSFGNNLVAGAEMVATANPDSIWGLDVFTGKLDGRLGHLLSDSFMVYGRLGGGYTTGDDGSLLWDVGAGAEFAVSDRFKLRGEVDRVDPFADGMDSQINGRLGVILDF